MSEKLDKLRATLKKEQERRIKLNNRSGVRKRRNLDPHSLPDDDVRFIDPRYNELFRVPDGSMVQLKFPNGRQYSEKVEYLDDYHMRIGSAVQHICEFAERMARSHATVEPEPLRIIECGIWNMIFTSLCRKTTDYGSMPSIRGIVLCWNAENWMRPN